jgi:hypothetical protein
LATVVHTSGYAPPVAARCYFLAAGLLAPHPVLVTAGPASSAAMRLVFATVSDTTERQKSWRGDRYCTTLLSMDDLSVTNGAKSRMWQDSVYWRKSTKSNFNGNCVEVATISASVLVRDSKNPSLVMQFSPNRWTAFIKHVRQGSL